MSDTHKKDKVFACQQCRVLKVKCVFAAAEPKCLKCTKSRANCIPVAATRSAKSPKPKRLRLVDLDSKLTGILHQLGQPPADVGNDASISSASLGNSPEVADAAKADSVTKSSVNEVIDSGSHPEAPHSNGAPPNSCDTAAWSISVDMSTELLNYLLDRFRTRQPYFPFVVIPPEWTSQSMMSERPFLLLAAVTSVTGEYPNMQGTLTHELKETLSRRIVVAGENNLDLLQGLIVHLAWYHHHLVPRSQLAYRTLYLAISMVVDLGLDHDFDINPERPSVGQNKDTLPFEAGYRSPLGTMAKDWHRAALGCYYLSSVISAAIQRPNRLPFNNPAFKRAAILDEAQEFDTDRTIQPLIRLQRIIERARDTYGSNGRGLICSRLHTHAEQLMADLDEWRYSLPSGMYDYELFATRYHSTRIWIYEMGLVYHFNIGQAVSSTDGIDTSPVVANLITSVDSAKDYLDCFLAMSIDTYQHLPIEEWSRLIMAFFLLYKLCAKIPDLHFWSFDPARQIIDLEQYLDVAATRLRQSRLDDNSGEIASGDVYSVLPEILESAKASYVIARDHPEQASQGMRAHTDVGSLHTPTQRGCPATGYWKRQAIQTDGTNGFKMPGTHNVTADDELWNRVPDSSEDSIY